MGYTIITNPREGNVPKPVINYLKQCGTWNRTFCNELSSDVFGDADTITLIECAENDVQTCNKLVQEQELRSGHLVPTPIDPNGRQVWLSFGDKDRYNFSNIEIPDIAQRRDALLVYVVLTANYVLQMKKEKAERDEKRERKAKEAQEERDAMRRLWSAGH